MQPELWNAQAFLGLTELRLGHRASAERLLEKSFHRLHDASLSHQAGSALISIYYESGKLDKVVNVLRSLERPKEDSPDLLYIAYRAYSDLAARALSSLAQVAPESGQMHQILAHILANQDDCQGAIAQYQQALKLDPELPGIHAELGEMILSTSNTEAARADAEKEFHRDLAAHPTNAFSEYMLGEIEWLRFHAEATLEHDLHAVELNQQFADAHIAAGKALTALGRLDEAVVQLSDAVRFDPRNDVAHYRLAQAYQKLGRANDAVREMAEFKELRDSHAPVQALFQQVIKKPAAHEKLDE